MAVEFDIVYDGNLICRAVHGPSRQTLTTDAPTDNGGRGSAFSPTDLVATALGTCMLTIMGLVAQRRGWDIAGTQCHVVKEMVANPVRRIGRLQVQITLPPNPELTDEARAALRQAALTCPVKESLHPDIELVFEMK
ncbi:MAG: OsmC family protein [Candidatus Sumerlaea chitinivorans]|uniref:Putative stress-induced protein OsmC n=1 Tax=Sumerlaea chitinivorans TaxID=2250252 RepID=A0A2Z4Y5T4_SUMC1|nr:putative stress-induced protein OsmC [Candidatus Sumerlaea chitinivorans]MCX7963016.1 OsmC family protein [Candidatus Sumerlaea chitinivorans]